jgi:hypothetical protein
MMTPVQPASITDEVLDFLVSAPSPEQIVAFHASETAQGRLRYLLDRNQNSALTDSERAELEEMSRVEHFFTMIKLRAMKLLKEHQVVSPQ